MFDPRQCASVRAEAGMGDSICNYTEVFRAADLTPVLKAEWAAYWKLDTVKNVDGFKLWEWWDSVEQKLPTL